MPVNTISNVRTINLGGVPQAIAVSGNPSKPALLILHGGGLPLPGVASRTCFKLLSENFLVVYWDQRGTGKSYSDLLSRDEMRLGNYLEDVAELTEYSKQQFNKDKIYLLGHSWGSMIGLVSVMNNPDSYYAYIGVSQQISVQRSDLEVFDELLEGSATIQSGKLKAIGSPSYDTVDEWLKLREIAARNGGLVSGQGDIGMIGMLRRMLGGFMFNADYSIFEPFRVQSKMTATMENIYGDMIAFDVSEANEFSIPITLFHGSHDLNSHISIAKEWFEKLRAPSKKFVEFRKSAHMIMWEEPEKFQQEIIQTFNANNPEPAA